MFEQRAVAGAVAEVRAEHAPGALILDATEDFGTLAPARAEELGVLVDALDPTTVPEEWLPADAPEALRRYAGEAFTVGAPADGGVAWTRQTEPPVVVVKPRLADSPEPFVEFLVAAALVEVGLGEPERCLTFFGDRYPDAHAAATPYLDPVGAYQVAAACYDAYLGLATGEIFAGWADEYPSLFDAWLEAGERLEPRLDGLPAAVAAGRTDFGDAAELACSAVKHASELPAPFDALATDTYREHGAAYAVEWIDRTVAAMDEAGD